MWRFPDRISIGTFPMLWPVIPPLETREFSRIYFIFQIDIRDLNLTYMNDVDQQVAESRALAIHMYSFFTNIIHRPWDRFSDGKLPTQTPTQSIICIFSFRNRVWANSSPSIEPVWIGLRWLIAPFDVPKWPGTLFFQSYVATIIPAAWHPTENSSRGRKNLCK